MFGLLTDLILFLLRVRQRGNEKFASTTYRTGAAVTQPAWGTQAKPAGLPTIPPCRGPMPGAEHRLEPAAPHGHIATLTQIWKSVVDVDCIHSGLGCRGVPARADPLGCKLVDVYIG